MGSGSRDSAAHTFLEAPPSERKKFLPVQFEGQLYDEQPRGCRQFT